LTRLLGPSERRNAPQSGVFLAFTRQQSQFSIHCYVDLIQPAAGCTVNHLNRNSQELPAWFYDADTVRELPVSLRSSFHHGLGHRVPQKCLGSLGLRIALQGLEGGQIRACQLALVLKSKQFQGFILLTARENIEERFGFLTSF
jgi:hypothetical protein